MDYSKHMIKLRQVDETKGNSLDLELYKEGEGWTKYNKKASEQATYQQLKAAMNDIAKQCVKQDVKYKLFLWYQGERRSALICKEFSF